MKPQWLRSLTQITSQRTSRRRYWGQIGMDQSPHRLAHRRDFQNYQVDHSHPRNVREMATQCHADLMDYWILLTDSNISTRQVLHLKAG